jgi:hypothetical protein
LRASMTSFMDGLQPAGCRDAPCVKLLIVYPGAPAKTATEAIAPRRNSPVDCGRISTDGLVFPVILALCGRGLASFRRPACRRLVGINAGPQQPGAERNHDDQEQQTDRGTLQRALLKIGCGAWNPGRRSQSNTLPRAAALRLENPSAPPRPRSLFGAIDPQPSRSTIIYRQMQRSRLWRMRYAFIGRAVREAEPHKVAARG